MWDGVVSVGCGYVVWGWLFVWGVVVCGVVVSVGCGCC